MEKQNTMMVPAGVFLAVLLCFAPLFLFTPLSKKPETPEAGRRFTVMTNASPESESLLYWEKVGSPETFAKPDPGIGFSALVSGGTKELLPEIPANPAPLSLTLDAAKSARTSLSALVSRRPGELAPGIGENAAVLPREDTPSPAAPVKLPQFRTADGILLDSIVCEPPGAASAAKRPTVLLVERREPGIPPLIRVVRSSGDRDLDIRAVRALALPAAAEGSPVSGYLTADWGANGGPE